MNGYGIPKGQVEENESIIEAAVRELKEETGIDLMSIRNCYNINDLNLIYLNGSNEVTNNKKIHSFLFQGNGNEKFLHSNVILSGFRAGLPENSNGKYFNIYEAKNIIHKNQNKLLDLYINYYENHLKP